MYDLLVVGAGPYGLSVAAHATAAGLNARVLGKPMAFWRDHVPEGTYLESEPWSSSLSDPNGACTLTDYCATRDLPTDSGGSLPVDTFAAYGAWFTDRAVPCVDERTVTGVRPRDDSFLVRTDDGDALETRTVAIAVGLLPFARIPVPLRELPPELASHSSGHHDLSRFKGRNVTVIGSGQSALETAALLAEQGADVRLVARAERIGWNEPPQPLERRPLQRLREPHSALGTGWSDCVQSELPWAVHGLPGTLRTRLTDRALQPAGAWWLRERFEAAVTVRPATRLWSAVPTVDGVRLHLGNTRGMETVLETEHVIAATGFLPELERLRVLDPALRARLRVVRGSLAPALDGCFQSSLPGLYFAGPLAAPAFGPVMRFVHGTAFTASRLTGGVRQRLQRDRPGPRRTPWAARLPRPASGAAREGAPRSAAQPAPRPAPRSAAHPAQRTGEPARPRT
ncbi:lysine N(6)-hydroxylase/L-ornithine N(5)-oxygenase family protein [Streptomyces sp. N2-109]|uniref:Lysine N(6)-hydroxylase/L-ornithine N(5)-oxygenase family protein n=1 Tax=Streptomyces gossypii TaxID=2883101 RepID=A0ABT2K3X1_9ACTN|nr:lysine N(6)-hydroxylase/L-ornithine N(5)-oxygenase family protein [Streptomyces gossypii]MCT2594159.1 lysine N(6)-hydroxylase/L-ornithine N(5)-oxygenase family protein [Streptomyces gossypii]